MNILTAAETHITKNSYQRLQIFIDLTFRHKSGYYTKTVIDSV